MFETQMKETQKISGNNFFLRSRPCCGMVLVDELVCDFGQSPGNGRNQLPPPPIISTAVSSTSTNIRSAECRECDRLVADMADLKKGSMLN